MTTKTRPTKTRPQRKASKQRRWRPSRLSVAICLVLLATLAIGIYPMAARWLNSYEQSRVLRDAMSGIVEPSAAAEQTVARARAYNVALDAGPALEAGLSLGFGEEETSWATGDVGGFVYDEMLQANSSGLMGRIVIDKIDVDLPIYHGTDPKTLDQGVGHLEGSHLPVGGAGTRAILTGHRGLVRAKLFTDLDELEVGDMVTVATFGEVLTYRVRETRVIEPHRTDLLRAVEGEDLLTLVTCTPLGVNTHRIVVTAERLDPTPAAAVEAAHAPPGPGFGWWALIGGVGLLGLLAYFVRTGFVDARREIGVVR